MTHKALVEDSVGYANGYTNTSSKPYSFDKSLAAQKRSSSMTIAERVVSVRIVPDIDDNGIITYGLHIEYAPDSRFSRATLTGKITLAGIVDSTEYIVKDGAGVWEASYEERWQGAYEVVTIDDATADEKRTEFSVIYYTNPMSAIHSLMSQDVASFFDVERDDLGDIQEISED